MGGRCSRFNSSLPSCSRSGPIMERPKPTSGGRRRSFAISSPSAPPSAFESPPPPYSRGQGGGGPRRLACGVGPHDPLRVVIQGGRGGGGLEASHALRVGLELCQLLRRVHLHSSHGTRGGVDPRKNPLYSSGQLRARRLRAPHGVTQILR